MSANVDAMVREGINAYKVGNKGEARALLLKATELDQLNEQAWLWLSGLMDSADDQRTCLENVLAINPNNERAKQGLSYLTGQTSAGNVSPFAAGSPPPAPSPSMPSSVEWASNDAPAAPVSSRPLPQEPAGSALDDWVSNLNLPVNDVQAGGTSVLPGASASPFSDFDLDDDNAFSGSNPFSTPIAPAPAASAPARRSNPMSPTPTAPAEQSRRRQRRKDESLLSEMDDNQDGKIEPGEGQMFGEIPAEIPATRLPGTREGTPALLRFGILVLIVLNLVVAVALMWNVLT